MKHLTIYLFLVLASPVFGQTVKQPTSDNHGHLLYVTFSNNGEIYDVIDQFYFTQGGYLPNNDVFDYKQSDPKFNFHYEYINGKNFSFCGKVGYSNRKDSYSVSNVTPADGSKEQNYLNIAFGVKYILQKDKFQFSTGVEIPYYRISTYKENFTWDDPAQKLHYTYYLDGGNAYGLNSVSSVKFFMTNRLFFAADVSFGLMRFDLGGEAYTDYDYQDPVVVTPSIYGPYNDSYKKLTVTKPEFHFGIGIRLGKISKGSDKCGV